MVTEELEPTRFENPAMSQEVDTAMADATAFLNQYVKAEFARLNPMVAAGHISLETAFDIMSQGLELAMAHFYDQSEDQDQQAA